MKSTSNEKSHSYWQFENHVFRKRCRCIITRRFTNKNNLKQLKLLTQ